MRKSLMVGQILGNSQQRLCTTSKPTTTKGAILQRNFRGCCIYLGRTLILWLQSMIADHLVFLLTDTNALFHKALFFETHGRIEEAKDFLQQAIASGYDNCYHAERALKRLNKAQTNTATQIWDNVMLPSWIECKFRGQTLFYNIF